ncbi:MAG: DUF6320 domain-containing protein [Peptococcaceae bacterium]|nr:DUF6320 domain-containing protein [Peptococcaceae bacterium]
MKVCEKCAVSVSGNPEKCPLCQSPLTGENQNSYETFPFIPLARHKHSLLFRLLQLASAAVVIAALTVNGMLPQGGFWSLFVLAGVACAWLSLTIAIRKRHNILKNLAYQVTVIGILSILWDVFTGWHGWSVDFVIPIVFVSAMIVTAILARILTMPVGAYMIYNFLLMLYGIIPAFFVLSGLSTIILPSLLCVACSLFSLAALLIFEGRNMAEELKRRLHL